MRSEVPQVSHFFAKYKRFAFADATRDTRLSHCQLRQHPSYRRKTYFAKKKAKLVLRKISKKMYLLLNKSPAIF